MKSTCVVVCSPGKKGPIMTTAFEDLEMGVKYALHMVDAWSKSAQTWQVTLGSRMKTEDYKTVEDVLEVLDVGMVVTFWDSSWKMFVSVSRPLVYKKEQG